MEVVKRTPKEWAEMTIRDIERNKRNREKGQKEAKAFVIERAIYTNNRHRRAKHRGVRSF